MFHLGFSWFLAFPCPKKFWNSRKVAHSRNSGVPGDSVISRNSTKNEFVEKTCPDEECYCVSKSGPPDALVEPNLTSRIWRFIFLGQKHQNHPKTATKYQKAFSRNYKKWRIIYILIYTFQTPDQPNSGQYKKCAHPTHTHAHLPSRTNAHIQNHIIYMWFYIQLGL